MARILHTAAAGADVISGLQPYWFHVKYMSWRNKRSSALTLLVVTNLLNKDTFNWSISLLLSDMVWSGLILHFHLAGQSNDVNLEWNYYKNWWIVHLTSPVIAIRIKLLSVGEIVRHIEQRCAINNTAPVSCPFVCLCVCVFHFWATC